MPAASFILARDEGLSGSAVGAESILWDRVVDPRIFSGRRLAVVLSQIVSGSPNFRLRLGGTRNTADGTLLATTGVLTAGAPKPVQLFDGNVVLPDAPVRLKLLYTSADPFAADELVVEFYDPTWSSTTVFGALPPTDPAAGEQFGVDIDLLTDLPRSFVLASGLKNLGNAIARRLSTPAGALAAFGDDPDYGLDLPGMLGADLGAQELQALGGQIEDEVLKDERVLAADVAVTFSRITSTLTVDLGMHTATGPFRLVLAVDQRTVEVINAGLEGVG